MKTTDLFDGHVLGTVKKAVRWTAHKYNVNGDDLEQDVLLKLLEKFPTLEDFQAHTEGEGKAYINTMVDNEAKNTIRREARDVVADMSETGDTSEPGEEPWEVDPLGAHLSATTDGAMTRPEEDVIAADRMQEIVRYVLGIVEDAKPGHQEVLKAYYLQGKDYAEAADSLGLPIGTVKSRIARARAALGGVEGALRAYREYAYPEARRPDLDANRPHSEAVRAIWEG